MRIVIILGALWGCFGVYGQNVNDFRGMPKYDSRYDYLEVDAILDSKRLVRNYVDCLINLKPCSPEGKALKRILPEALRTKCMRCTDRQKRTAVKVIRRLKYDYPDEWAKLASRWDPTGDFTRFFEEFLAKEDFNTIATGSDPADSASIPPRQYPPQRSTPQVVVISPSTPPAPVMPVDMSTESRPAILNRFGDDGELMMENNPPGSMEPRPMTSSPTTDRSATMPPTMRPMVPPMRPMVPSMRPMASTMRPMASTMRPMMSTMRPMIQTRPPETMSTRFPLRPFPDMQTTAITLIDQIGFKIMRTTELVTDILRNTVKAVVGR